VGSAGWLGDANSKVERTDRRSRGGCSSIEDTGMSLHCSKHGEEEQEEEQEGAEVTFVGSRVRSLGRLLLLILDGNYTARVVAR
jgi:hypothetical protein